MNAMIRLILTASFMSLFAIPVYAASSDMVRVYQACEKEAEGNEVEDGDFHTYMKQCMTDNGLSTADADTTLAELGPPKEQ